eukprot:2439092-Alexandrium_andersonii.AAC.1
MCWPLRRLLRCQLGSPIPEHATLELRGPRNGFKTGPSSSGGVRSAAYFAQVPNLPTRRAGAPEALLGGSRWKEPRQEGL